MNRLIDIVLRRSRLVVIISLVIACVFGAGAGLVKVTYDYQAMYGENNPEFIAAKAFEETYTRLNSAMVAVAVPSGSIFSQDALRAIEELTEAGWLAPYATRVDSLTNFPHSYSQGDDLYVEPLVEDAASVTDDDLVRIEAAAGGYEELVGRLIADDGRVGALIVTFAMPDDNRDQATIEISDYLDGILAQARLDYPELSFHLTGNVPLNRSLAIAAQTDLMFLAPVAFLLIVATAGLLLKSVVCTFAVAIAALASMGVTMGMAGWLGAEFSPLSSMVPIIVMAVSVAHSIHISTAALGALGGAMAKGDAIEHSLRKNARPMLMTTVTTMVGFLSLNASDSPPFHLLGSYVAFGVGCALLFSLFLVPALYMLMPIRPRTGPGRQVAIFVTLGEFTIRHRVLLLVLASATAAALVAGIPRNELTDRWAHYFDDSYEFRRDTDFIFENLTGIDVLEYSLDAQRDGGITDLAYLEQVEEFADWFKDQPEAVHVRAFPDVMKRLNRVLHGDDPDYFVLPEDPELAAQYLLLYELSLPFGVDLNDRINSAKSATRMTVVLNSLSSRDHREIDNRAKQWLSENAPHLSSGATGATMISAYLSKRNIEAMTWSTIIAMGLISLMLMFILKSIKIGLASLVPNFIPAAMSYGLWGYLVGEMGMTASVIAVIAFGIIVDDTIHFLSKYLDARREGKSSQDAVRYVFRTVGPALWITTAVLSVGFLIFALSGFIGGRTLGLLLTLTIGIALIADFLLLPALLMFVDRSKA